MYPSLRSIVDSGGASAESQALLALGGGYQCFIVAELTA